MKNCRLTSFLVVKNVSLTCLLGVAGISFVSCDAPKIEDNSNPDSDENNSKSKEVEALEKEVKDSIAALKAATGTLKATPEETEKKDTAKQALSQTIGSAKKLLPKITQLLQTVKTAQDTALETKLSALEQDLKTEIAKAEKALNKGKGPELETAPELETDQVAPTTTTPAAATTATTSDAEDGSDASASSEEEENEDEDAEEEEENN
jgi:hypothetical protein